MANSQTPQIRDWKLPTCKVYSTHWKNTNHKGGLIHKATIAYFAPRPVWYLGQKNHLTSETSVCSDCLQGASDAWHPVKIRYNLWSSLILYERPSFHKHGKATHNKLGWSLPDDNLRNTTKLEAGSFFLAKYILHSAWTPAPVVVCSGKQPLHFFLANTVL